MSVRISQPPQVENAELQKWLGDVYEKLMLSDRRLVASSAATAQATTPGSDTTLKEFTLPRNTIKKIGDRVFFYLEGSFSANSTLKIYCTNSHGTFQIFEEAFVLSGAVDKFKVCGMFCQGETGVFMPSTIYHYDALGPTTDIKFGDVFSMANFEIAEEQDFLIAVDSDDFTLSQYYFELMPSSDFDLGIAIRKGFTL